MEFIFYNDLIYIEIYKERVNNTNFRILLVILPAGLNTVSGRVQVMFPRPRCQRERFAPVKELQRVC